MRSQGPELDTRSQGPEPDTKLQEPEPGKLPGTEPGKLPGTEPDSIRQILRQKICVDVSLPRSNQIRRAR